MNSEFQILKNLAWRLRLARRCFTSAEKNGYPLEVIARFDGAKTEAHNSYQAAKNLVASKADEFGSMPYKTTLFAALASAGTVVCDGYEIDTQIDGNRIGRPDFVLLQCGDDYTLQLKNQIIEIDESGTCFCTVASTPSSARVVMTFMVTVPMRESDLLKSK